jgi:hypothetical protein
MRRLDCMSDPRKRFVVCLSNEGYPASLETRKLYVALPDVDAEQHGLLRVIDESGEDYLYPASQFAAVELPDALVHALSGG